MIGVGAGRGRTWAVTAVAFGTLVVAGGIAAVVAAPARPGNAKPLRPPPPASAPAPGPGGWTPVAASTTVPADSAVQQQYDEAFARGFASSADQTVFATLAATTLPAPQVAGGWPPLQPAPTPEAWTRQFVTGLLDIDFAHQTRSGLGAWLVAEEAPDLMPGVPAGSRLATLWTSLLRPGVIDPTSPIPARDGWAAAARAGTRWTVTGLTVQLEPQWQSMIAAGWQPPDTYASVEDVTGTLTATSATGAAAHRFLMVVQLGSAHWHPGYGTVLVSGWKESA